MKKKKKKKCHGDQSVNILFYVCSQQGDIRPSPTPSPKIILLFVTYTSLPTGLGTINLTIEFMTSVIYKVSLTLLKALRLYPYF